MVKEKTKKTTIIDLTETELDLEEAEKATFSLDLKKLKFFRKVVDKYLENSEFLVAKFFEVNTENLDIYYLEDTKHFVFKKLTEGNFNKFLESLLDEDESQVLKMWSNNFKIFKIIVSEKVAKKNPGIFVVENESDAKSLLTPRLVSFNNGVVDIATGKRYKHSPKLHITRHLNFDYKTNSSRSVVLDQYLSTTFNTDKIGLIRQQLFLDICTYCLFNSIELTKFFFFVGEGRNGKDLGIKLLSNLFPQGKVTSIKLLKKDPDRFSTSSLVGSELNTYSEVGQEDMNGTEEIKLITALNRMHVERKGQDAHNDFLIARLIFASNNPPEFNDRSLSIVSRLVTLDFPNSFSDRGEHRIQLNFDKALEEKEVLDDFASRLIRNLPGMQRRSFKMFKSVDAQKNQYDRNSTSNKNFINKIIVEKPGNKIEFEYLKKEIERIIVKYNLKIEINFNSVGMIIKKIFGIQKIRSMENGKLTSYYPDIDILRDEEILDGLFSNENFADDIVLDEELLAKEVVFADQKKFMFASVRTPCYINTEDLSSLELEDSHSEVKDLDEEEQEELIITSSSETLGESFTSEPPNNKDEIFEKFFKGKMLCSGVEEKFPKKNNRIIQTKEDVDNYFKEFGDKNIYITYNKIKENSENSRARAYIDGVDVIGLDCEAVDKMKNGETPERMKIMEEQMKLLQVRLPFESILNCSGNGFHLWIKLPVDLWKWANGNFELADKTYKALIQRFLKEINEGATIQMKGSDRKDLNGILRIPGSINTKGNNPVKIISHNPAFSTSENDLNVWLKDTEQTIKKELEEQAKRKIDTADISDEKISEFVKLLEEIYNDEEVIEVPGDRHSSLDLAVQSLFAEGMIDEKTAKHFVSLSQTNFNNTLILNSFSGIGFEKVLGILSNFLFKRKLKKYHGKLHEIFKKEMKDE